MDYKTIQNLVESDMKAVDALIQQRLQSDVVLVNQLSHYIINSGGKRLRPMLALLMARACGYEGNKHVDIAAIVEFIHTATLLHDDVVDESDMRRGKDTANNVWGNQAAVLVGDFLYSRAFEMMVDVNEMRVMNIMASTTNIIAEGEVLQLLNINDAETSEERYLEVIYSKTAKLFEAACQLGAVLSGLSEEDEVVVAKFGTHLGTAFQLVDDILDYSADSDEMGKNVGDDLAEGKPTLPLIYALSESEKNGNTEDADMIRKAIEEGGLDLIEEITSIIKKTKSLEYTIEVAKKETTLATDCLKVLPDSEFKSALSNLANYSLSRTT
ncbi:octaprenyl diphosphate synthase [Cocleimonas flava]|uniref:Octaprenyl diphosphate synthase n=1 Tax=Cocleimonas flava TaxID=634765 RepID=A0A4R1F541_9GAMM|nr:MULTISPECIES: octaprenyl diphosphate synthase [Cocleimonas]MEB8431292.1 octaprenyl diphosphate synthase [Cocleimonas sp. KMM 6892]MEC4713936.1 octaprenyl diphosphate synthase [Cocleimonas sp. KMM 6895]MEC4743267.1 octaprenyl diphosphate synthase [Cocleimonas sp. KMM 6896]TCJ88973.1 octaprenyl-diphosphate synthase [Cocleimonas flava]